MCLVATAGLCCHDLSAVVGLTPSTSGIAAIGLVLLAHVLSRRAGVVLRTLTSALLWTQAGIHLACLLGGAVSGAEAGLLSWHLALTVAAAGVLRHSHDVLSTALLAAVAGRFRSPRVRRTVVRVRRTLVAVALVRPIGLEVAGVLPQRAPPR